MNTEQERAEFEAWARRHLGMPEHIAFNWEADWTLAALEGYRAGRAALQTQDREDAERYRWLLKNCYRWPANGGLCNEFDQSEPVALWVKRNVGDDPCAAIDRARRVEEDSDG